MDVNEYNSFLASKRYVLTNKIASVLSQDLRLDPTQTEYFFAQLQLSPTFMLEETPTDDNEQFEYVKFALRIVRTTFPDKYDELALLFCEMPLDDFAELIEVELANELANPEHRAYRYDLAFYHQIPIEAHGFDWDSNEDMEMIESILDDDVVSELTTEFFQILLEQTSEKDKTKTETQDDKDEEDDDTSPWSSYLLHPIEALYESIKPQAWGLFLETCTLLKKSLNAASIKHQTHVYTNLTILLDYLFTKTRNPLFAFGQDSCENGIIGYRDWSPESVQMIYEIQSEADELIEVAHTSILTLQEEPLVLHALICNYRTLLVSLLADKKENKPPKSYTISSQQFIEGFNPHNLRNQEDLLLIENLAWPAISRRDNIALKLNHQYLSLWRRTIDESLYL